MAKFSVTGGVIWSAIERFSVQGLQFVMGIVIARLLLPSDYGLIAMLNIFMAISQVFIDAGFGNALTQKKNRTNTDCSTVFYSNLIMACVLYALLFVCAPFIASFYESPELTTITRVIGLTLVLDALGMVQQTRLVIDLNFRRLSIASLSAVITSGIVGIIMASNGYGVWALVAQLLINNVVRVILLWIVTKWHPDFTFSRASFKGLFKFSYKLLISSFIHQIYTNLYALVIGKKYSASELGFYSRAYSFANFPSMNISTIIERTIYPIFCEKQDNHEELNELFLKYMRMSCYIVFPLMVGLAAVAKPFIVTLLTDNWIDAVPLLQILCIAFMWDPIMRINHLIINAKGRSDYFLVSEIIKKVAGLSILFATIPFGVKTMCVGLILYSFADMWIIIFYNKKVTKIGWFRQLKEIFPVLSISLTMGAMVFALMEILSFLQPLVLLIIGVTAGIFIYLTLSVVFKFKEYRTIRSKITSML